MIRNLWEEERNQLALTTPIRSFLQIQPGEGRPASVMMLYSAAAAGGVLTVGFNTGQVLFFSRLPAADIPFTFILPASAILVMLATYDRLASRFTLPWLAAGSALVLLLIALIFRLLLATPYGSTFWLLGAIYLYTEAAASLVLVQVWTFAGQIFNPRQARRLFGLIAMSGTLASVLAGGVLAFMVRVIGVDNLLLVMAVSLIVCALCAWLLRKQILTPQRKTRTLAAAESRTSLADGLSGIRGSPLLRAIAAITALVALLINIGGYQFFLVLQSKYAGHGAALAAFLGVFSISTGLAALAVQMFATRPLMVRYGIFVTQALLPIAMGIAAVATLVTWGALWTVTFTRGADPTLRRTVHDVSLNALYLPVPAALRQRAKALLEGVYALTFGLAGVLFLVLQHVARGWTYPFWSLPVLVLALVWLAVLLWARRWYVTALADSVNARRLEFGPITLDGADDVTTQVLVQALQSEDARKVVHVLSLIADAPARSWLPRVATVLDHPSPEARAVALEYLGDHGDSTYAEAVAVLLDDPNGEARSAAVHALCALDPADAPARILPRLDDADARAAAATVEELLRTGDGDYQLLAATRLRTMLDGEDLQARREGIRVLGSLAGSTFELTPLPVLTGTADQVIRSSSGQAPPSQSTPEEVLVAHLIDLLSDGRVRDVATESLVSWGTSFLPAVGALVSDRTRDRVVRLQAVRIVQRVGTAAAPEMLQSHVADADEAVRAEVLRALVQLRAAGLSVDEDLVQTQMTAELTACYRLRIWRETLDSRGDDDLLTDALRERGERALDRVFLLLQVRYPGHDLLRARRILMTGDESSRAMVVELLDSLTDRSVKSVLVPLVEGPRERVDEITKQEMGIERRPPDELLAELAEGDDAWMRACALFRIGAEHDSRLLPSVLRALSSDDALVRETALATCARLLEPGDFAEILAEQARADAFPLAQRYAQSLLRHAGAG